MATRSITREEFERSPAQYLDFAAHGNVVMITEAQQQLRLTAASQTAQPRTEPRKPGLNAGKGTMAPDFDDPLPDEFWLGDDA